MASGQFKEDRAEAAAKLTAKDIGDVNRARERDYGTQWATEREFKEARAEVAAKLAAKDLEDANRLREREQERLVAGTEKQGPGVMGSMFKAVQDTYEHAKEAVVGKTHDAANTAGEYKDYAVHKAGETKDATKQKAGEFAGKAREAKDATVDKAAEYTGYAADKAKEAKDTTVQKAGEYKDYTAEKAKEGKDTTTGKLGELKDKAMGFFSGKKDETKHCYEAGEMDKDKLGVTDDAKRKLEELKLRERSHPYEVTREADEFRSESDWGRAAKNNIMGSVGSVGEAIKSKLSQPSDVVEETRASRERGGTGRRCGEEVLIEVEESRPGAVADTLRAADQMTGQSFNDVGRVGDEGTIRVQHRKNS